MNRLLPAIVLIKKVRCAVSRSQFSEDVIEAGAQLILQLGGIITPLILRRDGIEHYQVVEGALEYYAALRAKELDLMQGESVNAYIIDEHNENVMLQQLSLFKNVVSPPVSPPAPAEIEMNKIAVAFDKSAQNLSENLLKQVETMVKVALDQFKTEFIENMSRQIISQQADINSVQAVIPPKEEKVEAAIILEKPAVIVTEQPIAATEIVPISPLVVIPKPEQIQKVPDVPPPVSAPAKKNSRKKPVSNAVEKEQTPAWIEKLVGYSKEKLAFDLTHLKLSKNIIEEVLNKRAQFKSEADINAIKGLGKSAEGFRKLKEKFSSE